MWKATLFKASNAPLSGHAPASNGFAGNFSGMASSEVYVIAWLENIRFSPRLCLIQTKHVVHS